LTLWDFALATWRRPGVEEACLELQDRHGQSVALLLWGAWSAREGWSLDGEVIVRAVALAEGWESRVLQPMRHARRGLGGQLPGLDDDERAVLIERLQSAELEVERQFARALEAIAAPAKSESRRPIAETLLDVAKAWRGDAPEPALRALAARLG
jgi:uncharacterized protein (TIGR02444 family)